MVAYSFNPRFVDAILWGRKDQTIRLPRQGYRGHAAPGDKLQLYTGMRTSRCRLILRTVCLDRKYVCLRFRPIVEFSLDGERLKPGEYDAFWQRDGFQDLSDMEAFWTETHKGIEAFAGEMIRWLAPATPVEMGSDLAAVALAESSA